MLIHAFLVLFYLIAGPAVAGKIFELNNNYDLAFLLGGISTLSAAAIIFVGVGLTTYIENKVHLFLRHCFKHKIF